MQSLSKFHWQFSQKKKKVTKIHTEPQKTLNSQSNKNKAGGIKLPDLKKIT
jgi:hypothetical protein